jgi:hypothetical protein
LVNVLILAVASAVSPAILAVVIVVLHRPRPQRLLAAYLFGGMLTSIAVGIAIVSSLSGLAAFSGSSPAADPIVNFTVGVLALIVAYVLATDRDARIEERRREHKAARPARDPWSQRVLNRGTAPIAFAVGVVLNLPGAFYLVALKDIAQGQQGTGRQFFAIVLFNLIMFVLAEVPLVGLWVAPERTNALVHRMNAWAAGHGREVAIGVCIVFGVFLIVRGILSA